MRTIAAMGRGSTTKRSPAIAIFLNMLALLTGQNLLEAQLSRPWDPCDRPVAWAIADLTRGGETGRSLDADLEAERVEIARSRGDETLLMFWFTRLAIAYWFGDFQTAFVKGERAAVDLDRLQDPALLSWFSFYRTLAGLASYPNLSKKQRRAVVQQAETFLETRPQLPRLDRQFAGNFALVEAEKARVLQQQWQAAQSYDRAIETARDRELIHELAVCYERAAEFYSAESMRTIARDYRGRSLQCYQQWQARAKVVQLQQKYPELATDEDDPAATDRLGKVGAIVSTEAIALQESKKRFDLFFNQAIDGFFFFSFDFGVAWNDGADKDALLDYTFSHERLSEVNDAFVKQYGATREQLLGMTPAEFFPHDRDYAKQVWRELFDRGILEIESRERKLDGTPMWVEGTYTCLYDEAGRIVGHCGAQREITDRKQAENQLKIRERQQAAIAELGQEALATDDLEALMQRAVNVVAEILAVEYTKILELLPDRRELLLKVGIGWTPGLVGTATVGTERESQAGYTLYSDEPAIVRDLSTETRFNGPELLHQHQVVSGVSVTIGLHDRPYGVFGIHTRQYREFSEDDVHFLQAIAHILGAAIDRQQTQAALERSDRLYRTIAEHFPNGAIFLFDRDLRYLVVGGQALQEWSGYTPQDLEGKTLWEALTPDEIELIEPIYRESLAGIETPHEIAYDDRALLLQSVSVKNDAGEAIAGMVVAQDITERKQAQAQIAFQASLLSQVRNAVIATDLDGRITYYNAFARDLYRFADDRILGQRIFEAIVPPCEYDRACEIFARVQQQGYWEGEIIVQRLDGSTFAAYLINTLIRNADGEPVGFLGVSTDISDRKRAEEQLRQSEARFQKLVANIPGTIYQFRLGSNGTYCVPYASHACREIFEIDPELIREDASAIFAQIDRQDLVEVKRAIAQSSRTLEPFYCEYQIRTASGKTKWIQSISRPERQANGDLLWDGVAIDISDRKLTEEALRRSERRYELATRAAKVGVWEWNLLETEFYLDPNIKDILGYRPEEMPANLQAWMSYIHPDDRPQVLEAARAHLCGKVGEYILEHRLSHKDGSFRWFLVRGQAIRDKRFKVVRVVGTYTDITELKQVQMALSEAKEEAEAANRAKSLFLANMSHELRSPLNAILGFTQLLEHHDNLTEAQQTYLNAIARSGEHLLALINDILDFSKIEAGRTHLNENEFDLYQLLADIHQTFQLKVNEKGLQFEFVLAPDLPQYICSDRLKLRQVLINLLSNAVKFTDRGRIAVCVSWRAVDGAIGSPPRQFVAFTVCDTGIGIAPNELKQLFEPFVQTQSGMEMQEGTGLGLAICQRYVELMGGHIEVSSQLGEGSTFHFQIAIRRVSPTQLHSTTPSDRIVGVAGDGETYRILVADDRANNRLILVNWLSRVGFEVAEAVNGREAIAVWQRFDPHLIWMDMRMPVMDGYEATRQIKATAKGRQTKIVAVTASALEQDRPAIFAAGCDDWVPKPIVESVIFETMAKHLKLEYIYEDRPFHSVESPAIPQVLTAANLESLPPFLIDELREAILDLDPRAIEAAIVKIEPEHHRIAQVLRNCVAQFQYDKILKVLPQTDQEQSS